MSSKNAITYVPTERELVFSGEWDLAHLPQLQSTLTNMSWPASGEMVFNGQNISKMDSAGAWLIKTWQNVLEKKGLKVQLQRFTEDFTLLLDIIENKLKQETPLPSIKQLTSFAFLGKNTLDKLSFLHDYLDFVGKTFIESLRIAFNPTKWRFKALAASIYATGYQALPIIALLSFMIGVVIAYQMGLQLRAYGANIFIVDLLGLGILREFGPLLTAIMVAGRTGSAFTAQIGMMKLNQEVDALNTMGITPYELLILPRIMGLIITLPLLTMWANIFGILGGMVVANDMLNITWYDFLHRFPQVISLSNLMIGIGKAPVFALIIGSIGTFLGMRVRSSAQSLGINTTKSVVLSIFFIIVADAIFSIIFNKLQL